MSDKSMDQRRETILPHNGPALGGCLGCSNYSRLTASLGRCGARKCSVSPGESCSGWDRNRSLGPGDPPKAGPGRKIA